MEIVNFQIIFTLILGLHFLLAFTLYIIGIEPIYQHFTPFYSTLKPIYYNIPTSILFPLFFLIVLSISSSKYNLYKKCTLIVSLFTGYILITKFITKTHSIQQLTQEGILLIVSISLLYSASKLVVKNNWAEKNFNTFTYVLLFYIISILLCLSIASLRNGIQGIAEPYTRTKYEYIGDIGITPNIYLLLKNYHQLQPQLSLHAKLAPPGPLIILWTLSYIFGRSPLNLAIATVIFGSTALIPLYLWGKEISQKIQINPLQICILYIVMPGIILFTATSSEVLYMPFLFLSLYLFEKAINVKSPIIMCFAGLSFAILSFLKFTLLSVAIYFLLNGLSLLISKKQSFILLTSYALIMLLSFTAFYGLLHLSTGYRPIMVFFQAHSQFLQDLNALREISPRYSLSWFKFFNSWSWLYFSGIPIVVGLILTFAKTESYKSGMFWILILTLLALTSAYIAPGEGERSALYVYPFILLLSILGWGRELRESIPLLNSIIIFQLFQCTLTESLLYTYW